MLFVAAWWFFCAEELTITPGYGRHHGKFRKVEISYAWHRHVVRRGNYDNQVLMHAAHDSQHNLGHGVSLCFSQEVKPPDHGKENKSLSGYVSKQTPSLGVCGVNDRFDSLIRSFVNRVIYDRTCI